MSISIHALREEGDARALRGGADNADFYPRPPRGGRPCRDQYDELQRLFLSTPSARRATGWQEVRPIKQAISIHALREEGDRERGSGVHHRQYFYPRPPRGGRPQNPAPTSSRCYFYPRPPRGGRPPPAVAPVSSMSDFYPRPPRGGRRDPRPDGYGKFEISIHALREEGDPCSYARSSGCCYFYPRPPRGGRPGKSGGGAASNLFLSTPSARRATGRDALVALCFEISIHALREEGDRRSSLPTASSKRFLSTPSARRATSSPTRAAYGSTYFYPRPPRGGRQADHREAVQEAQISIHALREEGDAWTKLNSSTSSYFYPRPPRGGRHGL